MSMEPETQGRDVLAIGASAGGVQALSEIIGSLPPGLPAAVFVVLHIAPHGRSALPEILSRSGCLPAVHPADGEEILHGRIYVAPPDRHLAIADGRIHLSRNATENGYRPAIDVLFRSAARVYGPRVVGVVLTGNLDDGTAGLATVKRCGGAAVVQDPRDADYPGMPESAIASVRVDHVVPLGEIASLLDRLTREPRPAPPAGPCPAEEEPDAMGTNDQDLGAANRNGEPSGFTCPECGGTLYEKPGGEPLHFRCRTGHAFSPESLLATQSGNLENALWAALRALEENAALARRMEKRAGELGNQRTRERHTRRALDAEGHAKVIRAILTQGGAELETA
jgi:two-component system chemotaxis response regulator CheB